MRRVAALCAGVAPLTVAGACSYIKLAQTVSRFLLEQTARELSSDESAASTIVDTLFGAETETVRRRCRCRGRHAALTDGRSSQRTRCLHCRHESTRRAAFFDVELTYPESERVTFGDVMRASLNKATRTKASLAVRSAAALLTSAAQTWCERCNSYQLTMQYRRLLQPPLVLR